MKNTRMFCNFASAIIWLLLFIMFIVNPSKVHPISIGISFILLSLQFALHGFNDVAKQ